MKVSLHTIKQLIGTELPDIDTLVDTINRQLGGVEEVIDLGAKYKGATIVHVATCEKHPNADRLSICLIDDGGVNKDVERDTNGLIQVVCGASNVHSDMYAVWLPPKMTVPASASDEHPFVLDSREIRGVKSNGMLAAADELGIGSDHSGIIEIDPKESTLTDIKIVSGASFAKVYGLDDYVIDIENKMFTHRPDLFGQLGVARELFAILQDKKQKNTHSEIRFKSPEIYWKIPEFASVKDGLPLNVANEAGDKVKRFMCVVMDDVEIRQSPLWLKCALVAMGGKPINNVVDITNYIMLMTAQPTHAYDYDKLRGATLGVRMGRKGEEIKLLNNKQYEIDESDIVIVDGEGPVGLGGIMGGGESEVSSQTTRIVLEVAHFDMYSVRKSSMRHGIFTDALARFNKGQSPLQNDRVLNQLMKMMQEYAGANQASDVTDIKTAIPDQYKDQSIHGSIHISTEFINSRLGLEFTPKQIGNILRLVEFATFSSEKNEQILETTAPFWRTDIELKEDVVEEVGRLYGFDKLPRELPLRRVSPAPRNQIALLKSQLRESLRLAGANEALTYSFVHENVISRARQDAKHAYKLTNALSPDLQYYRLSLTPSLLEKVHMNTKAGHDEYALFEINKVHFKGEMDEQDPSVPNEDSHLALIIALNDKKKAYGPAYYHALRYLELVAPEKSASLKPLSEFDISNDKWGAQLVAPYDTNRSAVIIWDDKIWGVVGEFKQEVVQAFKLPVATAGLEVHLGALKHQHQLYSPLSKYPSVTQDISLKVASEVSYRELLECVERVTSKKIGDTTINVRPISIYQSGNNTTQKTITFRIHVTSYTRTLTDKDVNKLLEEIAVTATETLKAQRI